ncbi:hypothetical protein CR513_36118, partial [Mucuna pruriens]
MSSHREEKYLSSSGKDPHDLWQVRLAGRSVLTVGSLPSDTHTPAGTQSLKLSRFLGFNFLRPPRRNSCPSQGHILTLALLRLYGSLRGTHLVSLLKRPNLHQLRCLTAALPTMGVDRDRDHSSDNLAEGPYSWVDPEILRVSSVLTRSGSLLGMASAICEPRSWSVSVSACRDRTVLLSLRHTPLKLGIKLPFTHFERAVLHALNVAPTQLHPNSWAFVRAFELLCEDLGKAPTLGVFFWFFSPRKTDRVGWTSLSNKAKRKLLRSFLECYKTFKDRFFRVTPSDTKFELLTDCMDDRSSPSNGLANPPYQSRLISRT